MEGLESKIAIVGMAGRFPGADSPDALWADVIEPGVEAIKRPGEDDEPFVPYGAVESAEYFDHDFFDVSPAEARRLDPQHRLLLEYAWNALEDAGIDITRFDGIGSVYASCGFNVSYIEDLLAKTVAHDPAGAFAFRNAVSMNSLATRIGYKFDLRGECLTVQCACSSSLVGAALACESILAGRSDLAIVGGVNLIPDQQKAYKAQDGFILSSKGHCRALTDAADGLVAGEGVVAVVLRPLIDAMEDDNPIYAVINGTAINNDGKRKIGYTAPSVEGQVEMIEGALAFSGVDRDEVGFIECHGTGTDIGDAIEIRALRRVFETETSRPNRLLLGSVKANIGHLGEASGLAGLVKAALALHHRTIPPLVHADKHGPHPVLADSPAIGLPAKGQPWSVADGARRCAAVSSLGIGGTNAHVIMEEAPAREPRSAREKAGPDHVPLVWSGHSELSLEAVTQRLADTLEQGDVDLRDAAFTLQAGRAALPMRRCAVATAASEAANALRAGRYLELPRVPFDYATQSVFMFAGSGAYKPGMATDLLEEPYGVREHIVECHEILAGLGDFDLLDFLTNSPDAADGLPPLFAVQSGIFALQYGLARRMIELAGPPAAVIGSSLGEYVAASISGALSVEDALKLVFERGRLLEQVTGGAMLLVDGTAEALADEVDLSNVEEAIRVSPGEVAFSGTKEHIAGLREELEMTGHKVTLLPPNVAYHSAAIDPLRDDYLAVVEEVTFREPEIPYVSNKTGTWISLEELQAPDYWFEQMRRTVLLEEGFECLYSGGMRFFLEAGPGHGLRKFAKLNYPDVDDVHIQSCVAHPKSEKHDGAALAEAVGAAWMAGADVNWDRWGQGGRRVRLATYPFDSKFFHIAKKAPEGEGGMGSLQVDQTREIRAPRNPIEEKVASMWTEVLGVEEISIDDNFFDIGGDSLEATRVVSRIQMELAPEVSIRDVMELRTVEEMARHVTQVMEGGADTDGGTVAAGEEADFYCAFHMQMGDQEITVRMSREKYEERGLPEGATNVRFADSSDQDDDGGS